MGKEGKYCTNGIRTWIIALAQANSGNQELGDEWRIHFHVPLHTSPRSTSRMIPSNHVLDTLDWLARNPNACRHLEMETYTWEVLPTELQSVEVVEQIAKEYEWTLNALSQRGLANGEPSTS